MTTTTKIVHPYPIALFYHFVPNVGHLYDFSFFIETLIILRNRVVFVWDISVEVKNKTPIPCKNWFSFPFPSLRFPSGRLLEDLEEVQTDKVSMEYLLREKLERLVQSEIEARVARMHQVSRVLPTIEQLIEALFLLYRANISD